MRHLLLFARRPRVGRVKTRLAPLLGAEVALGLYRAFLADQLRFVASFARAARVEWWADGPLDPDLDAGLPADGVRVRRQGPGDLGQRLERAVSAVFEEGSTATVVVGADTPTLPRGHVVRAFERLEDGADAVLSPAEDGGYVLIGARGHHRALFLRIPWGGPRVAECTRARAAGEGLRLDEIDSWYDVDDGPDLRRLLDDLARGEYAGRAPETERVVLDSGIGSMV